jgi:hypothetical protein
LINFSVREDDVVTEAQRKRFEKHLSKMQRRAVARYLYGRAAVPSNAVGIEITGRVWGTIDKKYFPRWWFITPGLPQDAPAKWRVSFGDERGPIGHETSDVQGRSFESKYDAIYYVMQSFQNNHPRITGYVLPGRGKIDFRGFTNNARRGLRRLAKGGRHDS